MTNPLAVKVAQILGIPPGDVLMVARMEREKDPQMRAHLEAWVSTVGN